MSIEAMTWALRVPVGGNQKVVLLGLANHAHPDGTESYPTLDTLAAYAHCDRSTARRNVRKLVADGWATEDGLGPRGQTRYRLPLGGGKVQPVAAAPTRGSTSAPEGVAPVPPEPSLETVQNHPPSSGARDGRALPEEFPRHLESPLDEVVEILTRAAAARSGQMPARTSVARAMMRRPRKPWVRVAEAVEHWLVYGKGQRRPCGDVVARWRTWLDDEPDIATTVAMGPRTSQLALVSGRRDAEAERQARQARRAAVVRGEASPA